jgi:hypothetical protein
MILVIWVGLHLTGVIIIVLVIDPSGHLRKNTYHDFGIYDRIAFIVGRML